jgi:MFS family permease
MNAADTMEDASLRRDWRRFTIAIFLFAFGFSLYGGVFQNFLKDRAGAQELDLGILESLREIPGFCTALMAGVLVAFAESRVAAAGLAITAIGIAATGLIEKMPPIIAVTVFWSIGFHLYATMQSPITLALAKGKEGGRHLGRMSGLSAMATIAALGTAWVMAKLLPHGVYEPYFLGAGVAILGAALAMSQLGHHAVGAPRQAIILRREYGLFYLLQFLEGCRRQIFAIFASFTLVLIYKVPVDRMLALQFLNAALIAFTAPRMGKWIDQHGEKRMLLYYGWLLIFVFLGYALIPNVWILMVLFIIDNVLFTFNNAFTTYLHRIVRPGELTPCVSMGITFSHVAAVTVPIGGAYLWKASGNYQTPFWVGVVLAIVSLIATRFIPARLPAPEADPA